MYAVLFNALIDYLTETLLIDKEFNLKIECVFGIASVDKAEILRNGIIEYDFTESCGNKLSNLFTVYLFGHTNFNLGMKTDVALVVSHGSLINAEERFAFARLAVFFHSEVVRTEYHILCGNGNRFTVGRLEKVICGKHKEPCLCLSLCRKRYVNSHLVTVEVRVECGTSKRVKLNGSALYKYRLKCLNTESVKSGSTVKHNGVILNDYFESVPNLGLCALYHFSRRLDVACNAGFNKTFHNERLKQLKCHFLGKTALMHFKLGSYYDNGTAGIVDTFTEEVLSETTLLTFKHIGKRFKSTVVGTRYGSAASAIVYKSIDSLLKHSLFVSYNYIGSVELKKSFKTVVSVDNTSVKIVEVRRCKSAAVELYHRTDIGRNYRNNVENHPFGTVTGKLECFGDFKSFKYSCFLLTRRLRELLTELLGKRVNVDFAEKLFDGFGAHTGLEVILILLSHIEILFFGEYLLLFKLCITGIGDNIFCEIENLFKLSRRNVKDKSHS